MNLKANTQELRPPCLGGAVLDLGEGQWVRLGRPVAYRETRTLSEVRSVLAWAEAEAEKGRLAVGFVAYEAAPAFDSSLQVHSSGEQPLISFGLWEEAERIAFPGAELGGWRLCSSKAGLGEPAYRHRIESIHGAIARGETYQVNFTFPLEARLEGAPWLFFRSLLARQPTPFGVYFNHKKRIVASVSPELFFERNGRIIRTKPMKGTAARELSWDRDQAAGERLGTVRKERAENVMIVDMMRHDLGRIAVPGTVRVPRLFEVERHPTVWQMTSTVEAETAASHLEVFDALFPCSSITGAPKRSTMEWIHQLEDVPRGLYTGAIGFMARGGQARFSVGIRTAVVDRESQRVTYGVGSGVVWDSEGGSEYQECLAKAAVLWTPRPEFDLLETLLWRPRKGYWMLERHLERLQRSALYFGYPVPSSIKSKFRDFARALGPNRQKVRARLDREGRLKLEASSLPRKKRWIVALDREATATNDPFIYHKTTYRHRYQAALDRAGPGVQEVILFNPKGELTEATRANLVLRCGERLLTPHRSVGLLPGVLRAKELENGALKEAILKVEDLRKADEVWLINSVRGWIRAEVVTSLDQANREA